MSFWTSKPSFDQVGFFFTGPYCIHIHDFIPILKYFLVATDTERFDIGSFIVADVDGARIAAYIMPSRECYFLGKLPRSVVHRMPWEILFKPVFPEKNLYQCHLEFIDSHLLPNWYEQRQVSHVEKATIIPIQGMLLFFFYV